MISGAKQAVPGSLDVAGWGIYCGTVQSSVTICSRVIQSALNVMRPVLGLWPPAGEHTLMVSMQVGSKVIHALVDTGSTLTLVSSSLVLSRNVVAEGCMVCLQSVTMSGQELESLKGQVLNALPGGVDFVPGLDTILHHGLSAAVRCGKSRYTWGVLQ